MMIPKEAIVWIRDGGKIPQEDLSAEDVIRVPSNEAKEVPCVKLLLTNNFYLCIKVSYARAKTMLKAGWIEFDEEAALVIQMSKKDGSAILYNWQDFWDNVMKHGGKDVLLGFPR